ncbi:MAG: hypothetical protein AB7S44_00530 [Spirochaetales bacterium]
MKFVRAGLSYMFKNFLYMFLFAIIPAVFLGLLLNPFKIFEFIKDYASMNIASFDTIFNYILNINFLNFVIAVFGMSLLAIFVSAIIGQIENHMRSGKTNFRALKEHVNSNILVVIANMFAFLLIAFVIMFLTSTLLFLTHLILSGINNVPTAFNVVLSTVIVLAILTIYALIAGVMFLNVPSMIVNGSQFKTSLASVIKLVEKDSLGILVAVLVPTLVIGLIAILFSGTIVMPLISVICVALLIMYYSSLSMTAYYTLTQTTRYDNKRKYYYK